MQNQYRWIFTSYNLFPLNFRYFICIGLPFDLQLYMLVPTCCLNSVHRPSRISCFHFRSWCWMTFTHAITDSAVCPGHRSVPPRWRTDDYPPKPRYSHVRSYSFNIHIQRVGHFYYRIALKLCLFRTAASNGPNIHLSDERWINMKHWRNDSWQCKTTCNKCQISENFS